MNLNLVHSTYKLTFADQRISVGGTCLLVRYKKNLYLVSARHCIDQNYRDPVREIKLPYRLGVEGFARAGNFGVKATSDASLIVDKWEFDEEGNDLAIGRIIGFSEPLFSISHTNLNFSPMNLESVLGNDIVISGFPEEISSYNGEFPALVTRQGIVATHYQIDIDVPKAIGRHYGLIDAYSQNGFSGAPVWLKTTEAVDMSTLMTRQETDNNRNISKLPIRDGKIIQAVPKYNLLGINCGHFKTSSNNASNSHSGLSYYVKVDRILKTLLSLTGLEYLQHYDDYPVAELNNRLDCS